MMDIWDLPEETRNIDQQALGYQLVTGDSQSSAVCSTHAQKSCSYRVCKIYILNQFSLCEKTKIPDF